MTNMTPIKNSLRLTVIRLFHPLYSVVALILILFMVAPEMGRKVEANLTGSGSCSSLAEAMAVVNNSSIGSLQPSSCGSYFEEQTLVNPDGLTNVMFAEAMAISGNTVVIGAPWDNIGGNNRQGSAFVFVRSGTTWSFQQKLTASDGAFDDRFGSVVTISGDTIVIGAPLDNIGTQADQGSAYVFVRSGTTWSLEQKITASDGTFGDELGTSVALEGNTVVIGAPLAEGAGPQPGAAYVFVRSGTAWSLQQKLTASGGGFGVKVALSGETALIGAPGDDIGVNTAQGSCYVFVRSGGTWSQQQKLIASDGSANEFFGQIISVSGDTAAIGLPGDTIGTNQSQGSAYVFVRSGTNWSQQQKITDPTGNSIDYFGSGVAVSGDSLFLTAPGVDVIPNLVFGTLFVYVRSGTVWNELQRLTSQDGLGDFPLAVDGNTVVTETTNAAPNQGGAKVFVCSACAPISLSPTSLPNATLNIPYIQTFTAVGGANPYSFAISKGSLPSGLTLAAGGLLSGVPDTLGQPIFTVRAADNMGCTGTRPYALKVVPPCGTISIMPPTLPIGFVGIPYNEPLSASGGSFPYTFSLLSGSLPNGLSLSMNSLVGIPTTTGMFNFTIRVTDINGCTGTQSFTMTIVPPCPDISISPSSLPSGVMGVAYNQTFTQTGGVAPITWSLSAGSLPSGLSLNSTTGVLSGTPTAAGGYSFTLRATDANNCFGATDYTVNISSGGLQYYPLSRPIRLFDTRAPIPGFPACAYLNSPLIAGQEIARQARISCDGITIPSNAQAIVGNATVIGPSGNGFVTLWPNGQSRPPVSNLNYVTGQIVPNAFTVGLGNDGQFRIYSASNTDFAIDVTGYFAPASTAGLYYHPLPNPIRLLDTRAPIPGFPACANLDAPLVGDAEIARQARISCDGITIPADAQAIVGNATVVGASANGFATLWPNGQSRPSVSNLNYVTGQVVPNAFTVGLGNDGQFRIYTSAETHFIVDVAGYYSASQTDPNGANALLYTPLPHPIRLFDTRAPIPGFPACEYLNAPLIAGGELTRPIVITCDGVTIPIGAQAIVGNATVVGPVASGFVTIYPNGQTRPSVSNLNFVAGQTVPNAFTVKVGGGGLFVVYSSAGTHFITDVTGYFAP